MKLFVYGTLMVPDIMREVSGYDRPGRVAVLRGYVRRCIVGEVYPGVVACEGEAVDGVLYDGVDAAQVARLDRFEGALYARRRVEVLAGGRPVAASCYVVADGAGAALSDQPWSLESFLRDGHGRFVAEYRGFAAVGGRQVADERKR